MAAFTECCEHLTQVFVACWQRIREAVVQMFQIIVDSIKPAMISCLRLSLYYRLRRWPAVHFGLPAWLAQFIAYNLPERWLPAFCFP